MLNPMLPEEVAVKDVPRQQFTGFKQIFVLSEVSLGSFIWACSLKRSDNNKYAV